MQFDLRKFITAGARPYHAEFQCDLSACDYAGARIPQPVTAVFDAQTDGDEVQITLRAKALVHGECARCLDPVTREETVDTEWIVKERDLDDPDFDLPLDEKDTWTLTNGSIRSLCSRSPRCCFAAPTAPGFARSAVRKRRNAPAHRQSRPMPP